MLEFYFHRNLGDLSYIRIWHDNSGEKKKASWYLKFVIVHDLQTREERIFICDKWLAIGKDDSLTDRILPVSGEKQKTDFKYLLKKQSSQRISDSHLWFSVLAKPVYSSFLRLDRLTCCFVLLLITMVMNIAYYSIDKSSSSDGALNIGPLSITLTQVI